MFNSWKEKKNNSFNAIETKIEEEDNKKTPQKMCAKCSQM